MPYKRSYHKNAVFDTEKAVFVSIILVLWHVVARIASANRRIAPWLVSYSFDSDCAQFCHQKAVE